MHNTAVGIYTKFLCHAWNSEPIGTLPNDNYVLYKLSGADTQAEWDTHKKAVLDKFKLKDGRYYHARLIAEREKQLENQERAKNAADSRWGKK